MAGQGKHPNSLKNLEKGKGYFAKADKETLREIQRRGAKNSNEAQKHAKDMEEAVIKFLSMPNAENPELTNAEAISLQITIKALGGDLPSAIFLRDTSIGKPKQKQEITGANGTPLQAPILNIIGVEPKEDGKQ